MRRVEALAVGVLDVEHREPVAPEPRVRRQRSAGVAHDAVDLGASLVERERPEVVIERAVLHREDDDVLDGTLGAVGGGRPGRAQDAGRHRRGSAGGKRCGDVAKELPAGEAHRD